ncbi:Cyclolysin [Marinibacterium anthonyi]|nr:Cyclolysin [Marinibacterium anthonyi]
MVQIRANDALGTGLVIDADAVGAAVPLFATPLETTENRVTDLDDGTKLYRFFIDGHATIVTAGAVTIETATSIEFVDVTYKTADGAQVLLISDIDVTISDETAPPQVLLDPWSAVADVVAGGRVSLLGDDVIIGNGFADNIRGDQGNDTLYGRGGDDFLYGDDGDDLLKGGAGADYMDGGAGIDTVSYTSATAGVGVDLADNDLNTGDAAGDVLTGIEKIAGSTHADTLAGTDGDDTFYAGAGDDTIHGKGGRDLIKGGAGDDMIFGDAGDDVLIGGAGNDVIHTGSGADSINAGAGDDIIFADQNDFWINGGAGNDTADFSGASGRIYYRPYNDNEIQDVETIVGSNHDDLFWLEYFDGALVIDAGAGDDTLQVDNYYSATGPSYLNGEDGEDYLYGVGLSVLTGGADTDTFAFYWWNEFDVTVTDWDGDNLRFDQNLLVDWDLFRTFDDDEIQDYWDNFDPTAEDVLKFAKVVNGNTVFDFGDETFAMSATLQGVTDPTQLIDYISIV